jgi:hypothetical protein
MENQSNSRTTKSDIGGTVYVVESRISDSAKESAYSKLKRLITVNAKTFQSYLIVHINPRKSTRLLQGSTVIYIVLNRLKTVGNGGEK